MNRMNRQSHIREDNTGNYSTHRLCINSYSIMNHSTTIIGKYSVSIPTKIMFNSCQGLYFTTLHFCLTQLMVNGWFGARWSGIGIGVPLCNNPWKGIPGIQTTGPQTTNKPLAAWPYLKLLHVRLHVQDLSTGIPQGRSHLSHRKMVGCGCEKKVQAGRINWSMDFSGSCKGWDR